MAIPKYMVRLSSSLSKRLTRQRRFPLLVRRRGTVFLLDPRNWIDNRIIAGVAFENEQIARAARLIAERGIDTVIDIGANFGLYTVLLARLPGVRTVYAFEPVKRNYSQLLGNVFANALTDRVKAYQVALGSEPARRTIHIDPESTGVSRLELGTADRDLRVFRVHEEIDVARFDDLVDEAGRRCFVKIDVEGAAFSVISGMRRFLQRNDVFLQIEIADNERGPVAAALSDLGFVKAGSVGADVYFQRMHSPVELRQSA